MLFNYNITFEFYHPYNYDAVAFQSHYKCYTSSKLPKYLTGASVRILTRTMTPSQYSTCTCVQIVVYSVWPALDMSSYSSSAKQRGI